MFGFIILLVGTLGFTSCGSLSQNIEHRYISNQSNIKRLNDSVVALVIPTQRVIRELHINYNDVHTVNTIGRNHSAYCSGFFVSRTEILTAAHCVRRQTVINTFFGPIVLPSNEEPIGDLKKIATYANYVAARRNFVIYRTYEVVRYNQIQDLALLRLAEGQSQPTHYSVLTVGADPRAGEQVYVIGHPARQPWSLTEGIISRPFRIRSDGQRYTQTSAQVFFGNSGGPLINNRGEAIGISSRLVTPHIAFFTHIRSIRSFLNAR